MKIIFAWNLSEGKIMSQQLIIEVVLLTLIHLILFLLDPSSEYNML